MIPSSGSGRRGASRLVRFGLPGAVALLVLAATIAVIMGSRPAAAARHRSGGAGWVTSWMVPSEDGGATKMQGGAAIPSGQIDHFEVRTKDGRHLVTLKSH